MTKRSDRTPDGRIIVDRQPAYGEHPNPKMNGRQAIMTGVSQLLLADGETPFACDACGRIFGKVRSAVSHLTAHNPAKNDPLYDVNILKTVLRTVLKHAGYRNKCERAAAELNALGLRRRDGKAWTSGDVSRLHRKWHSRFPVRVPRVAAVAPSVVADRPTRSAIPRPRADTRSHETTGAYVRSRRTSETSAGGSPLDLDPLLSALEDELGEMQRRISTLTTQFKRVAQLVRNGSAVSAEVRDKLRRYDKIVREIGV